MAPATTAPCPPSPCRPRATAPPGLALATGIMIALWNRERTGNGTKVSSSLFANGIWANGNAVQAALIGAPLPKRPPLDRPRSALANAYRTRDDRWFQLTLVREDRDWPGVCRAIEREDLTDRSRGSPICPCAGPTVRRSRRILSGIFDAARLRRVARTAQEPTPFPFAAISRAEDLVDDEQAVAAGAIVAGRQPRDAAHARCAVLPRDVPLSPPGPGPALGAHSEEILREAGVSAEEIAALKASGALG